MIFDSHAHYNDDAFSHDADKLLNMMNENGIEYIMNSCSSMDELDIIKDLSEKYPFVYSSVGVHPECVGNMCEKDLDILLEYSKHKKVRAIGEIGLDYFYKDEVSPEVQRYWFSRQVELAIKANLPVIIHDRDAHRDTLDILKEKDVSRVSGVFHCYSGSGEMVHEVLDLSMYIAFGGAITFKNNKKGAEAVLKTPLDKMLVETDCPYLTPHPLRGKRNNSMYIPITLKKIAEIKGVSVDEVEKATNENAKKLFNIN